MRKLDPPTSPIDSHLTSPPQEGVPVPRTLAHAASRDGKRELSPGSKKKPDPTRYGDWERNGRCIDF
jgi:hypothetical protein